MSDGSNPSWHQAQQAGDAGWGAWTGAQQRQARRNSHRRAPGGAYGSNSWASELQPSSGPAGSGKGKPAAGNPTNQGQEGLLNQGHTRPSTPEHSGLWRGGRSVTPSEAGDSPPVHNIATPEDSSWSQKGGESSWRTISSEWYGPPVQSWGPSGEQRQRWNEGYVAPQPTPPVPRQQSKGVFPEKGQRSFQSDDGKGGASWGKGLQPPQFDWDLRPPPNVWEQQQQPQPGAMHSVESGKVNSGLKGQDPWQKGGDPWRESAGLAGAPYHPQQQAPPQKGVAPSSSSSWEMNPNPRSWEPGPERPRTLDPSGGVQDPAAAATNQQGQDPYWVQWYTQRGPPPLTPTRGPPPHCPPPPGPPNLGGMMQPVGVMTDHNGQQFFVFPQVPWIGGTDGGVPHFPMTAASIPPSTVSERPTLEDLLTSSEQVVGRALSVSGESVAVSKKEEFVPKGIHEKTPLPWFLQAWNGKKRSDGVEMGRFEFEKRVTSWVEEFSDRRNLGLKLYNSMLDPVYTSCSLGGLEDLKLQDGWLTLIKRVHRAEEERGTGHSTSQLKELVKFQKRPKNEPMEPYMDRFQKQVKRTNEAMKESPDDPDFVSSKLHGGLLLEKAGLGRKEKREITRDAKGKPLTKEQVADALTELHWDAHREGGKKSKRRSSVYAASNDRAPAPAPRGSSSSSSSPGSSSGSSEEDQPDLAPASSGDEDDSPSDGNQKESHHAARESDDEEDSTSSGAGSSDEENPDDMHWKEYQAFVAGMHQSAKQRLREQEKNRGFVEPEETGRGRKGDGRPGGSRKSSKSPGYRSSSGGASLRGRCAICKKKGHWKNECPQRDRAGSRGSSRSSGAGRGKPSRSGSDRSGGGSRRGTSPGPSRRPSKPKRGPPGRPKGAASYFAISASGTSPGLAPGSSQPGATSSSTSTPAASSSHSVFIAENNLVCHAVKPKKEKIRIGSYMAESLNVDAMKEYGRRQGFGSWWNRALRKEPHLVQQFIAQDSARRSLAASGNTGEAPGTSAQTCHRWENYRCETELVGAGVIDSACNRTMMGADNLEGLRVWSRQLNLDVLIEEVSEPFTFRNSDTSIVTQQAVVPIEIEEKSGELRVCLIPNSRAPLLLSKDDLAALRMVLKFGKHQARLKPLSNRSRELSCTASGHFLLPLGEFPKDGHQTQSLTGGGERVQALVDGPSLTIYAACAASQGRDESKKTQSGLGNRMAYKSAEVSIPAEEGPLDGPCGVVFPESPADEMPDFPVSILDNWKEMSRRDTYRSLGYRWTGLTSCERTDGTYVDFLHKKSREALWTPVSKNRPLEIWTGRRVTRIRPIAPDAPPLPQAMIQSPEEASVPSPQWGRSLSQEGENKESDEWVSPDCLPAEILTAINDRGK